MRVCPQGKNGCVIRSVLYDNESPYLALRKLRLLLC